MRRQTPIAHQLYNYLFPHPTTNDPSSFSSHLARNLVPEVRIEVAIFYGDLNSTEARYPGLNYCYGPHRMRLGRFKHHKRLFDAFEALGLTCAEIQDFCCWEGTKWARERYEKDEGVKVLDTTGDEIGPYVDRRERRAAEEARRRSITRKTEISVIVEEAENRGRGNPPLAEEDEEENDEDMSDADSAHDSTRNSYDRNPRDAAGTGGSSTPRSPPQQHPHFSVFSRRNQAINQSILTAWDQGISLPADIEQYLKEQSERGNLDVLRTAVSGAQNGYIPLVVNSSASTATTAQASASRAAA